MKIDNIPGKCQKCGHYKVLHDFQVGAPMAHT